MVDSFFATKLDTTQAFDSKGNRLVATNLKAEPLTVTQIKTNQTDRYWAVQVAIGQKSPKHLTQPLKKHLQGAKLKSPAPLFLRELRLSQEPQFKVGDQITLSDVFQPHDQVKVSGLSKGRGFAGVIKRWGFHGGPRTHGQSDRERAPGSIGQRTDPGRVWKGKKMPGHYGHKTITIRGLQVLAIDPDKHLLQLSGTVPGSRRSLIKITKLGQAKRPLKLYQPSSDSKPSPAKPVKKDEKPPKKASAKPDKVAKSAKPTKPAKPAEPDKKAKTKPKK